MFDWLSTTYAAVRRPEHTGENRCLPCTVVNVVIALVLAGTLWAVSPTAGAVALAVSVGTIGLRGYLVPGTPALTRRYLPEWTRQYFGKSTSGPVHVAETSDGGRPDPETVLLGMGLVTDCPDRDDRCLTPWFRERWLAAMDDLRGYEAAQRSQLASMVDVPTDAVSLGTNQDGLVYADVDGNRVGQWLSRPALLADVAANRTISRHADEWTALSAADRGTVLSVLRVFLEHCPACGGAVETRTEAGEGCCGGYDSITVRCVDCEARLYAADATSFRLATGK
ncbi:hypothetical protein ACFQH6_04505 [Halobacteriaceae archaeon GCM10025711]